MGKVYVSMYSEYIELFDEIGIEMSTNDQIYKEVPIHEDKLPETDTDRMKEIGYIDLDQIHHEIHVKSYFPPQGFSLPLDVSKEDVLRSFHGRICVSSEQTNKDKVKLSLVFIAILGVSFTILSLIPIPPLIN